MSELAIRERSARQSWAKPGSSYDWVIRSLKVALPCGIGALLAYLVFSPIVGGAGELSFVLDKKLVAFANERLRLIEAVYRGEDTKGRPFKITAGSAIQKTSLEPIIRISNISAEMQMPEGLATLNAENARYDMDREVVSVIGPVRFQTADGYRLDMTNVDIGLKTRQVTSNSGAAGALPQGSFSAGSMTGNMRTRQLQMGGGVRGGTPMGSFAGAGLTADLDARLVTVTGGVNGSTRMGSYRTNRLVVDQRGRTILLDGAAAITGTNNGAPITLNADRIDVQEASDRAYMTGNVSARQGNMTLRAARLTVATAGGSIARADASGGVVVTRGTTTARGGYAIYEPGRRLVTLAGGVVLNKGGNILRGGRLVVDLASDRAIVDGRGGSVADPANPNAPAQSNGRVSGQFNVSGN
jgi:lipopolysaccharide export system protein LptC